MTHTPQRRYIIEATRYDAATERLYIQFRGGLTWTYVDVPQDVASALRNADSLDKFYMREIRDRYQTVDGAPPCARLARGLDMTASV